MSDKKQKFFKSFTYAGNGFIKCFTSEFNFRFQLIVAILVLISSFILKLNSVEWAVVLLACGLVLGSELFNTAIELITNVLFDTHHQTAEDIKDISAAAVLVNAIIATCAGLIIFLPKVISLFN